jgi:hypothetical protein
VKTSASQGEGIAVWGLQLANLVAVLVVYSVVDPSETYEVSRSGLEGGLSRGLVLLNFPIALASLVLVLLALDALPRRASLVGAPALALCAVVGWPGVVDPNDLDARAVNVIPAAGAALAFGLTIAAGRRAGWAFAPARAGDRARVVAAIVLVVVSIPWITAAVGWHFPQGLFLTSELYAEPGHEARAAVHLGQHHSTAGLLLALSALLLSRPRVTGSRLRAAYSVLVSLMLAYGVANVVNDLWHEQVVKRGWASWDVPEATQPELNLTWALVLVATIVLYAGGFGRPRSEDETLQPAIIT